jgi:hypothetical protein
MEQNTHTNRDNRQNTRSCVTQTTIKIKYDRASHYEKRKKYTYED